ncbi:hypothetical protein ACPR111641_04090 [Acinetobacter pragensis]
MLIVIIFIIEFIFLTLELHIMNSSSLDAAAIKPNTSAPSKHKEKASLTAYRFMIFYRFALALVGGYLLASLSAVLIAQYFIDYRASAAMSATLIAFLLYAAVFIWVFMVNKTLKASLGVVVPCLILFILIKISGT